LRRSYRSDDDDDDDDDDEADHNNMKKLATRDKITTTTTTTNTTTSLFKRTLRRSKSSGDSAVGESLEFMRKNLPAGSSEIETTQDQGEAPKRKGKKNKEVLAMPDMVEYSEDAVSKVRKSKKTASTKEDPLAIIESKKPKDEAPKPKEETTAISSSIVVEDNSDPTKKKKPKKDKVSVEAESLDVSAADSTKYGGKEEVSENTKEEASSPTPEDVVGDPTKKAKKKNKKDKAATEADKQSYTTTIDTDSGGDQNSKAEDEIQMHVWEALDVSEESARAGKEPIPEDDLDVSRTPKRKSKEKKKERRNTDKEGVKGRKNSIESEDQSFNDGGTPVVSVPVSVDPKDEYYYDWSPRKTPTKSPKKNSSKLLRKTISDGTTFLVDAPPLIRVTSSPVAPSPSPMPPPLSRVTLSATEASQRTCDTNLGSESPDRSASVSPQSASVTEKKKREEARLDVGVGDSPTQTKNEVDEDEALISYGNSILKMFTDDPTHYSDAAILALLHEFPQSASIKFTLELSCFRGGKAKTRHYLLSLLCALGASRETITLCYDMNPDAIHKFDEWVGTPLHYAISFGITASFSREMWTDSIFEAVEYLIEKEPLLLTSQHNNKMETVLHQAILCLCPLAGPVYDGSRNPNNVHQLATLADVVVSLLLENQPLLAIMPAINNILPLHLAAMHAVPSDIVQRIQKEHIEACSVVCESRGFTPLHYAAEVLGQSSFKFIDHNKRRGDNEEVDLDLLSSRLKGHSDNIQFLVTAYPAAARLADLEGNLPLHVLIRAGYGDSSTHDNAVFQTPGVFLNALLAIRKAYSDAANITDSRGYTPLQITQERKKLGDLGIDAFIDMFDTFLEIND
jgi:hypothetical protein